MPSSSDWEMRAQFYEQDAAAAWEKCEERRLQGQECLVEMKAAAGYLRNARIDLETGATKATAIRTIDGGLRRLEAAILRLEEGSPDPAGAA